MNERLNGKTILPVDLVSPQGQVRSIVESIVLASSNRLRLHLGLRPGETLTGAIPKIVTRRNPSLDNYFAELLLRTCYEAVDYLPAYEEHLIQGSQDELPSELNLRLVDAILIGIGGRSKNPDFKRTYDEHAAHGTRTAKSVSQIVFQEHLGCYQSRPGLQGVVFILNEINIIDSHGGASSDHLSNIAKSLHAAQFPHPGFVLEYLEPQWKRAVIGACLMSVCVSVNSLRSYDGEKATTELGQEWDLYAAEMKQIGNCGYPDQVDARALEWVKGLVLKTNELKVGGTASLLSLKRILFSLQQVWPPPISSFLVRFLFEAMRQAQQSFEEMKNRLIPTRRLQGGYAFAYYRKERRDKFPHRGLLARMNAQAMKALVVVHDSDQTITAVFGGRFLPKQVWRDFVNRLLEKEGEHVWYTPTQENGEYAKFVLNGTESFSGVPRTALSEEGLLQIFSHAVESYQRRRS